MYTRSLTVSASQWGRYLVPLVVCAASLPLPCCQGADKPMVLSAGISRLEIERDGRWRLVSGGRELIRNAQVVIATPDWKSSTSQRGARQLSRLADSEDGRLALQGEIPGPGADIAWDYRQESYPGDGGWRLVYQLQPRAAVEAGEISLFLDLPIQVWSGWRVSLWPASEGVLPEDAPAERHFLSGPARTLVLGHGGPSQLTLRLKRSALWTLQDTRAWKGECYQAYVRLHQRGRLEAGQKLRLEFELRPDDPAEYAIASTPLVARQPLAIVRIDKGSQPVPRWGLLRLRAEITGSYDTPFDPDQMAVDAHFRSPSGKQLVVPAFFTQDYQRAAEEDEYLTLRDRPHWEARFTPVEAGAYQFYLSARDRSGTIRSEAGEFHCRAAEGRGFVRVSGKDRRYFEFDNGEPYFAVGENTATCRGPASQILVDEPGLEDFRRWFTRLGAAGGNYARIWMCSPYFGIEWGKPGVYRLDHAWRLDRAMELAEKNGIYVKLCLESWRGFAGPGSFVRGEDVHPYWKRNGGPCEKEIEVFTHPEARRMFRNRLRYLVARWGYSTHLMGWEFWNEINCVRGYDAETVARWTQEMARYLNQIDPWRHLVVNSLGSFLVDDRYWRLPEVDFAQVHGYWHPKAAESREMGKDMGQFVPHWIEKIRGYGKPALFAEYGLVNDRWGPSPMNDKDLQGVHLHNGLWSSMMAGAAGTAMLWWWDSYVDPHDLYPRFGSVAAFSRDVPWTTAGFEPVLGRTGQPRLRAMALRGRSEVLVWLQNKDHTWWNVVHGSPIATIPQAAVAIEGLAPGVWEAQWWDTWAGRPLRTENLQANAGTVELNVKGLARDVAVKLKRVRP